MLNIRGLQTFSLVDYPGKISCIIFMGGCNFRCPFCHNPCLVFDPESQPAVTKPQFFHFLQTRMKHLEGVVISGGEPTLYPELPELIAEIRKKGFLVKLDTNGSHPEMVKYLLENKLVNTLGIDYKAPAVSYLEMTKSSDSDLYGKVASSIRTALESGCEPDIRTTVHKHLLSEQALGQMYSELKSFGVSRWVLQQYNPVEVIDDDLSALPTYSDSELVNLARNLGPEVHVRGLSGHILNCPN